MPGRSLTTNASAMIGSLRGTLLDRSVTGELLVEVAGVGYRVTAGPVTAARLGDLGGEVSSGSTITSARTRRRCTGSPRCDERNAFEALLGATASVRRWRWRSCRSTSPRRLRRVLADDDVAALVSGPRRRQEDGRPPARRAEGTSRASDRRRTGDPDDVARRRRAGSSARADVRDALAGLGYGPTRSRVVLRRPADGDDAERCCGRPSAAGREP